MLCAALAVGVRRRRRRSARRARARVGAPDRPRAAPATAGSSRTEGAPPSIAPRTERRARTAWRLPGPADLIGGAAHGPVAGYVAEQAMAPGEDAARLRERPAARGPSPSACTGWAGTAAGAAGWCCRARRLRAVSQPPCTHRYLTGLTECHWHATLSFRDPAGARERRVHREARRPPTARRATACSSCALARPRAAARGDPDGHL